MATTRKSDVPPAIFTDTRDFITRYSVLSDEEADICAMFAIGTWTFSPMCQWPATFPYLYITGPASSGKTVLGQDVMGVLTRQWESATGATGATLFHMCCEEDEETGELTNYAPTLCMDEIDATFNGAKDESLRGALNAGYKRGATIPRVSKKTKIQFPVFCPKIMMGIDNGHLPHTVTTRSIRIELTLQSQDQLDEAGVEPFYVFDIEDEKAELQERLAQWAKDNSMVLRDYRPKAPRGMAARQWETGRSLIQLAHAMGPQMEARITKSLLAVLNRRQQVVSAKTLLFRAIDEVFTEENTDRLPSLRLLQGLLAKGLSFSGNSPKALSKVLEDDGIGPANVRISAPEHRHMIEIDENGKPRSDHPRGYYRHQFDAAIIRYVPESDEDAS